MSHQRNQQVTQVITTEINNRINQYLTEQCIILSNIIDLINSYSSIDRPQHSYLAQWCAPHDFDKVLSEWESKSFLLSE